MNNEVAAGHESFSDWPRLICSLALLTAALQLVPLLTMLPLLMVLPASCEAKTCKVNVLTQL